MAIICDKYNLLFICVPKTASTSVSQLLIDQYGGRWIPEDHIINKRTSRIAINKKHTRIQDLLDYKLLTPEDVSKFQVYAVTRNPFDWAVSGYLYRKFLYQLHFPHGILAAKLSHRIQAMRNPAVALEPKWWMHVRLEVLKDAGKMPMEQYLEKYLVKRDSVYRPFIEGSNARILQFENLEEEIREMLKEIGAPAPKQSLQHVNKTRGKTKPYQEYYTPNARNLIETAFADDLKRFDYRFEKQ